MFRRALVLIVIAAAVVIPFNAIAATGPSGRVSLAGNAPPWATSSNLVAQVNDSDQIGFRVYLNWRNEATLEALATAVSNPASSSYRQFLSAAQFRQQFAPSALSVAMLKAWLKASGFKIVYTPANNLYVSVQGTFAQATAAFNTSFAVYRVNGLKLRAPKTDPSVPLWLAPIVSGIVGLDDTAQLVHTDIAVDPGAPPSPAFVNAQPCSAYWGEKQATGFTNPYGSGTLPYTPCGYTPQQILGAYGISGYDGSGQTVAVVDAYASPTIQQDLDQWSTNRGLSTTQIQQVVAPGTYNIRETQFQDPQGWYGEETLDIEAVHGMAPKANIVFVGAANANRDLDAALNNVIDQQMASIVTNSYGYPTELLPRRYIIAYNEMFMQAQATGIGLYFSSGDNSDESQTLGYVTADFPPSSPWVTAVGGTSLAVGAGNSYLFETGWGTSSTPWNRTFWYPSAPGSWIYGSGGGVSRRFDEPDYEMGVVPQSVFQAQHRTGRAVPDISADGDPNTGYLIGQTQTFPDGTVKYSEYRIGGTSLSSPLIAGVMALVNQAAGGPLGFVNPLLYSRLPGSGSVNDVVSPNSTVAAVRVDYVNSVDSTQGLKYTLRTFNQTLSLQTTTGWDDVTGLGTPHAGFIGTLSAP